MVDDEDPIDADLSSADWPKRTPDTLWELQEAVRRESTPVISGEGWYIWLDIEKLEWAADVDESPIAILRDKFPRDILDSYVAGGKTKEQLYGDAVEYLKKWGSDAKVSMLPPLKKKPPQEPRSHDAFRAFELRGRRRKKRPKMGSPRAPVKMGAFAGCGTGAGGFKPGNRCGKEDGIPNKPVYLGRKGFAQVGEKPVKIDRAKLKEQIAAGKAKADAKQKARMAEDKKKSIQIKRQKAAERKSAKEAAEAEAAKKAAEAAAAKKAAMLQQIRLKNASKRLAVVDVDATVGSKKPLEAGGPPAFGEVDRSVKKAAGETRIEFAKRTIAKDLASFHAAADALDAKHGASMQKLHAAVGEAKKRVADAEASGASYSDMWAYEWELKSKGDKAAPPSDRVRMLIDALGEVKAARAAFDAQKLVATKEHHALVSQFTAAHGGGASGIPSDPSAYQIEKPKSISSNLSWLSGAIAFLGQVASKKHRTALMKTKIKLRTKGGGHYRHSELTATISSGSVSTAVHEYGHAIESHYPEAMRALDEDYGRRLSAFLATNKASGLVRHPQVSYYEGPELSKDGLKKPLRSGYASHKSLLGYAMRYSDFGYNSTERARRPSDPRYGRGTEVFSTGLESMHGDPYSLRKNHRDHYDIVLLILSGRL